MRAPELAAGKVAEVLEAISSDNERRLASAAAERNRPLSVEQWQTVFLDFRHGVNYTSLGLGQKL
eukprot:9393410-Prorocentrum_lima.AAC.1